MPKIIPPNDKKRSHTRHDRALLIGGAGALIRGFLLLLDIALGVFLLFIGLTALHHRFIKK